MRYISEKEYHATGNDEHQAMVVFPDKDAIYLECTKEEIGNIDAVKDFLRQNNVQYEECRISYYKKEKKNE